MKDHALVEAAVMDAVVAEYEAGRKLRQIEQDHNLTRSQVYWVLEQRKVAPSRAKKKSRLEDGDDRTIVRLYEVVEAQDKRIRQLEAYIAAHGMELPDHAG